MKSFVLLLISVAVVAAKPTDEDVVGSVIGVVRSCSEKDVSLCLKEKALKYAENLSSAREINLVDGVTLVSTGSSRSARSFEPLSEEPRARESQVESRLVDAAADFLENHVIQLRVPKDTVDDVKRSLEEGRGKKKKLKQLIPIFALLNLKIQSLIPLFLGIIAFAAVKGLLLAKAALLASALLLLKKLLSKNDHHESYEVVAHPHHEEHYSHGGGHGGWGRSQDAQNLAYSAYSD
ncbi:osiris 9 precursor [Danaus plexippus plexippus]|uniref:Osiris 9 n=1 Tax=Danaus plexippus plexippus TaxID=278856 RepID=A0A212FC79_DANPL|nr:osiris 9 precursor [Danaus plexippus plexippus]